MQIPTQPQALPDREACFRELMSTVNLIAVMLNARAEITYCNDYFLKLTGWTFAEIEGRPWHTVFAPQSIEDLSGLFGDLFKDLPGARHYENDILTRAGERRCIRWNNMLLRDESGVAVGAASIGDDITERRALERQLLDASARERRQLQGELHDGLGQELFGVAMLARSLATAADREGLPITEDLVKLSNIASRAIDTCRRIARGFSPLSDLQGGLFHALKGLTNVPRGGGPKVEFSGTQAAPLSISTEALDHVYRIAQEGVTNALKHADARRIRVNLDVHTDTIGLQITDDGVGLPPVTESTGVGLKIMRYRANLLQAQLRFERPPEGGTRVSLRCRQGPAG